jgi:hypothetical protein
VFPVLKMQVKTVVPIQEDDMCRYWGPRDKTHGWYWDNGAWHALLSVPSVVFPPAYLTQPKQVLPQSTFLWAELDSRKGIQGVHWRNKCRGTFVMEHARTLFCVSFTDGRKLEQCSGSFFPGIGVTNTPSPSPHFVSLCVPELPFLN